MKELMAILMAALLLCGIAIAEDIEANLNGAQELKLEEITEIDLDGDGENEIVRPQMQGFEFEESLQLLVQTSEQIYFYDTYIMYPQHICTTDIDGDGNPEILMTGDEASADYTTWCLKFDPEKGIQAIQFADANRGENTSGYFDYGYGRIIDLDSGKLKLLGSQDALGTWWCTREFTLKDGRFELDDGGTWKVINDVDNPDTWEFMCLTLVRELEVTLEDGTTSTLPAGEKFVITETDKTSFVNIQTKSGIRGTLAVEPDTDEGWGYKIHGINEAEYFDYVPYAD